MNKVTKRTICQRCLRPTSTCMCGLLQPIHNQVELIILQHPLEVKEAKNTARLLHLCLNNSQLHVGETFTSDFFTERFKQSGSTPSAIYDLLLYPSTAEEKSLGIASPPVVNVEKLLFAENINTLRLWVLDATWRKSRKMLYLNPELQAMPRLSLQDTPASLYCIRKAHSENQLSTLEASCYALQQLEHKAVDYSPVLMAFAAFMQKHQTFIPSP